ncbi:SDR family NAD(P)-dependent oxidoreductase [Zavarzinia sp.]|uniref:SDR family NAD(P)-dependent oxidoreductase n=1 Tax=Zavarzinia sp. TaxID=2027920 RepID=UPI0035680213
MAETAVVVGATGAFGRAIVARLAAAGLRVVMVGRGAEALSRLAAEIAGSVPCVADIGDDAAIAAITAKLDGPVRIAVHGPGLTAPGSVGEIATASLVQAVNLKAGGMLRLTRAVDGHLVPGARLVAIAGHYGLEPAPYAAAAGVANAALLNLARQLSLAYGPRGITAHAIAPGPADTERLWRIAEAEAGRRGVSAAEIVDGMRADSATGALTTPEEVAWAVALLLAPEAAAMAGSTLMLDCGRRRGLP